MNYIAHIPFIPSMGSISPIYVNENKMETKEENLLWTINNMREHDNLPRFRDFEHFREHAGQNIIFEQTEE